MDGGAEENKGKSSAKPDAMSIGLPGETTRRQKDCNNIMGPADMDSQPQLLCHDAMR